MWVSVSLFLLCQLFFIAFTCSNHLYLQEVDVVFKLSQVVEHGALPLEGSDLLLHLFDQTLSSALCCSKTRLHHLEARAKTKCLFCNNPLSQCFCVFLFLFFTSKNLPWQCSTVEMSLEKAQTASSVSFSAAVWWNKKRARSYVKKSVGLCVFVIIPFTAEIKALKIYCTCIRVSRG